MHTLKAWNPRIIMVGNSGFGPTGEWAERASFDGMAQSFTGITTVQGGGPSCGVETRSTLASLYDSPSGGVISGSAAEKFRQRCRNFSAACRNFSAGCL